MNSLIMPATPVQCRASAPVGVPHLPSMLLVRGLQSWWWLSPARAGGRRLLCALGLGLAAWVPAAPQEADTPWRLHEVDLEADLEMPVRVYLRERPGAVPAFRASTVVEARLAALAAVLLDDSRTQDWVYRARRAELLHSDGPMRGVTRVITGMPFPLADREAVVAWEMTQDAQTLVVTLSGRNAPDAPPPHPDRVRMPTFESRWTLTPRADGRVDVVFEGLGDPGGALESPLLRHFVSAAAWQGPWYTVRGLHQMVRRPEYAQAQLDFIREPQR
jgi:hypothetical protein